MTQEEIIQFKKQIDEWIERGLADSRAWRVKRVDATFRAELKKRIRASILHSNKQAVWITI